jgi:multicomponent Na+:H+ antiporter subunit E
MTPTAAPLPERTDASPAINAVSRFFFFSIIWIIVSEGSPKGWGLALAIVVGTTWISLRLAPPLGRRIRALAVLEFVPFFLELSLRGGVDVAFRAMRAKPALDPDLVSFDLRLPAGPQRVFLAAVLGLFPGTLCTRLAGDRIEVHVLDLSLPVESQFRDLEVRIGALFGVPILPSE